MRYLDVTFQYSLKYLTRETPGKHIGITRSCRPYGIPEINPQIVLHVLDKHTVCLSIQPQGTVSHNE